MYCVAHRRACEGGGQGQRGEVALAHPLGPAAAFAVVLCGVGHPGASKLHC